MEKFDIENFKKIGLANEQSLQEVDLDDEDAHINEDGDLVIRYEFDDVFQEDLIRANTSIKLSKIFDKNTLRLKSEGEFFHGFAIGVHKTYDENGQIIEEVDNDLPYSFSLDDVRQKILTEFGKDIMDAGQRASVSRSTNPAPHYVVVIPLTSLLTGNSRAITLNGGTGAIEADEVIEYTD
jgi:hypothetical protein